MVRDSDAVLARALGDARARLLRVYHHAQAD